MPPKNNSNLTHNMNADDFSDDKLIEKSEIPQENEEQLQKLKERIKKFGANPNSDLQKLNAFRVMKLGKAPKQQREYPSKNNQKSIEQQKKVNKFLADDDDETIKNRLLKFKRQKNDEAEQLESDIQLDKQIEKSSHKFKKGIHKTNSHQSHSHKNHSNKYHNKSHNSYKHQRGI